MAVNKTTEPCPDKCLSDLDHDSFVKWIENLNSFKPGNSYTCRKDTIVNVHNVNVL